MVDGVAAFCSITTETSDQVLSRDLDRVASDVAACFAATLGPPLGRKPLRIAVGPCPRCVLNDLPHSYRIHLTQLGRDYCRFVYQLAHEIGHVYCNPYKSNWLIETLCEMASQVCLRALADQWKTAPPFPNWRAYACHFGEYLSKSRAKHREACGIAAETCLRSHWNNARHRLHQALEDKNLRERNGVLAEALIVHGLRLHILPVVGQCCPRDDEARDGSLWDWLCTASSHPGIKFLQALLEPLLKHRPAVAD